MYLVYEDIQDSLHFLNTNTLCQDELKDLLLQCVLVISKVFQTVIILSW